MPIHVTPIPRLTTLVAPAFTLGTANAAGSANTAVASDSTLLVFDGTLPAATGTAAVGAAAVSSRRDHVHASTVAATQAEEEAASSATVYSSPARQQFHPSAAKVWARWADDGAVSLSYNVTSTAKASTGTYTITIANDLSTNTYVGLCVPMDAGPSPGGNVNTAAVGSFNVSTYNSSHALTDMACAAIVFGTL
jgi:hypothetical protein